MYLVYTSEKNRGLTLRLHFMLIAAWAVGALKTLTQSAHAYQRCVRCAALRGALLGRAAGARCWGPPLPTAGSLPSTEQAAAVCPSP